MLPDAARAAFRPPHTPTQDLRAYARWEGVTVPRASAPARSRSPARSPARRASLVARFSAFVAARRTPTPTDERFLLDTLADRRAPGRP